MDLDLPADLSASDPALRDSLLAEVTDALARGLLTPAEVAGIDEGELAALGALTLQADNRGDPALAHRLACAYVVLAPYSPTGWRLLRRALQKTGDATRAEWADRALHLLMPSPPQFDDEAARGAAPEAQKADDALALLDGRALPLRTTPAAQHHDTPAARAAQQALCSGAAWVDTVHWATRTYEGLASASPAITQTSIVRRRQPPAIRPAHGLDKDVKAGQAHVGDALGDASQTTQTSRIRPPWAKTSAPPQSSAAPTQAEPITAVSRRLGGWPMTDEITLAAGLPPRANKGTGP